MAGSSLVPGLSVFTVASPVSILMTADRICIQTAAGISCAGSSLPAALRQCGPARDNLLCDSATESTSSHGHIFSSVLSVSLLCTLVFLLYLK